MALFGVMVVITLLGSPKKYSLLTIVLTSSLVIFGSDPWLIALALAIALAASVRFNQTTSGAIHALFTTVIVLMLLFRFEQTGLFWPEVSKFSWFATRYLTGFTEMNEVLALHESTILWLIVSIALVVSQLFFLPRLVSNVLLLGTVTLFVATISIMFNNTSLAISAVLLPAMFGFWNRQIRTQHRGWRILAGVLSISGAILVTLHAFPASRPTTSNPILGIIDSGLMSMEMPDRDEIKKSSLKPLFGTLSWLLERAGWGVNILPHDFEFGDLKPLTVLTVINPTEYFTDNQYAILENFVQEGGRLQVLGDHTNIFGTMDPLNKLLAFTSIRFRFDSAIPLYDSSWRWQNGIRGAMRRNYCNYKNSEFNISVGASLSTGSEATVLVNGDHAFSDVGRQEYGNSRLGDMLYNRGELRGGLPLVVEERVGEGVVEVWGDTSSFQSSSVTSMWQFHVLNYNDLAVRYPSTFPRIIISAFVLLSIVTVGVFCFGSVAWQLGISVCVCFLLWLGDVTLGREEQIVLNLRDTTIIDVSHTPRYSVSDKDGSLVQFVNLVQRTGSLCLEATDFDATITQQPHTWIIVAPTEQYDMHAIALLEQYVSNGGRLIIFAGAEERGSVQMLLDHFGMEISRSIFGAAHRARVGPVDLRATLKGFNLAQPVTEINSIEEFMPTYDAELNFVECNPILTSNKAEHLVTCWGRPIAVALHEGKGSVILVADPRFPTKDGLELKSEAEEKKYNESNAQFIFYILDY